MQVNISGEATKSGASPGDAVTLARQVAALPRLRLRGFMGIAEPTGDVALQRAQFATLAQCRDAARAAGLDVDVLSMGMTADLEAAKRQTRQRSNKGALTVTYRALTPRGGREWCSRKARGKSSRRRIGRYVEDNFDRATQRMRRYRFAG